MMRDFANVEQDRERKLEGGIGPVRVYSVYDGAAFWNQFYKSCQKLSENDSKSLCLSNHTFIKPYYSSYVLF